MNRAQYLTEMEKNRKQYYAEDAAPLTGGPDDIPAGATYRNARLAAYAKSEEFPAHQVIDHFYSPEAANELYKLTKETGMTFHLLPDLISDILGEIYGKVREHKDYHDNHKNDSDEGLLKIKQYDIINDRLLAGYPDFEFEYYHWNDPVQDGVFGRVDDEEIELMQQWGDGVIAADISLYALHTQALNHGKMVAAYDPKAQKFTYHRDVLQMAKTLARQNQQNRQNQGHSC